MASGTAMVDLYNAALGRSLGLSWGSVRPVGDDYLVELERSAADLDADKMTTRREHYLVGATREERLGGLSFKDEVVSKRSPSGRWTIKIFEDKIDAYDGTSLVHRVKTSHGKVLSDVMFGGTSFSHEEDLFAYVADAKKKNGDNDDEKKKTPGASEKSDFVDDFGEKFVGVQEPTIFVLKLDDGSLERRFPDDVCGQPAFQPGGGKLAYRRLVRGRKLGAIYCFNRPAEICIDGDVVSAEDRLARSPLWTPDGALLYLGGDFDTHDGMAKLVKFENGKRVVLVDEIWGAGTLSSECWLDNGMLLVNDVARSLSRVIKVDTVTGDIKAKRDACVVIAATSNSALLHDQRLEDPGTVVIADADLKTNLYTVPVDPVGAASLCAKSTWDAGINLKRQGRILQVPIPDDPQKKTIEAILAMPVISEDDKTLLPLIVVPHGGPHSVSLARWSVAMAFLNAAGFATLEVNYRGSLGGFDLDALPGHIGERDVADCVAATHAALKAEPRLDATKVGVCGGSHGGYLAATLIAAHADLFKVCCLRNPVCNLVSMLGTSDIPDWVLHEGLTVSKLTGSLTSADLTQDDLAELRRRSPITSAAKVTAPTLIAIGLSDRRVPPSQGIEFFHALTIDKKKLLTYSADDHAIDKPWSTADHWVHIASWLRDHLL